MALHQRAIEELERWLPEVSDQRALREAYLAFLAACPDACQRSCDAGHLTASAVVMSRDGRRTALVHHKIVGAWLQPGGHLEDDASLAEAALREAREETGIAGLLVDPLPLHLNVHPITCRGRVSPTRHFDVRFVAVTPADAELVVSDESHDVRWFEVDELPEVFDEVREIIALAGRRIDAMTAVAEPRRDW